MNGEQFLKDFVNYEAKGVPDGAGTDTKDGFDLVSGQASSAATLSPNLRARSCQDMLSCHAIQHRCCRAVTDPKDGFDLLIEQAFSAATSSAIHQQRHAGAQLPDSLSFAYCTTCLCYAGPHEGITLCNGRPSGVVASCSCGWHQGQGLNNCLLGMHTEISRIQSWYIHQVLIAAVFLCVHLEDAYHSASRPCPAFSIAANS